MEKVIAADLDGTLTQEVCWTEEDCLNATPRQEVIDLVNEWHKTNFIVIYTARRHSLYEATVKWLGRHGVKYHSISMEKLPADIYLDDRAINPNKEVLV